MSDSLKATRTRIENALALIEQQAPKAPANLGRTLALARGALESALETLSDLEAQLDTATDPDLDAAAELPRVRRELDAALAREIDLSLKVRELRGEIEASQAVQAEEEKRAREASRKVRDFEKKLMSDDDAFKKYMDATLDADERQGRGR